MCLLWMQETLKTESEGVAVCGCLGVHEFILSLGEGLPTHMDVKID